MQKNRRTWQTYEEMRKAAEEGDPQAQCYLGVCFQNGQGVQQDYHEAVKWFRKAADQNDPAAKDDIVVIGELHVPVDRPVIIELSSKDVIHNFCLPHMRIAQDAIPGAIIPMWFKPLKTGTYEVVCGQLCGLGHYSMKGTLVVDSPADYQVWLKERAELGGTQAAPPPTARPPGEPPVGPTPGTVAPPGAPKTVNPTAQPPPAENKPAEPAKSPNSGE